MVAEDRNEPASNGQLYQHVEHALGVHSSVHVVAQRDERVVLLWIDGSQDRAKGVRAAVNVSDGDSAGHEFLQIKNKGGRLVTETSPIGDQAPAFFNIVVR